MGLRCNPKDRLTALVLDLLGEIQSFRAEGCLFWNPCRSPGMWQPAAIGLKKFASDQKIVDEWWKVMLMILDQRYPSQARLVKAYGRFVTSPSKQKGPGTVASQLRATLKRRLESVARLRKSY